MTIPETSLPFSVTDPGVDIVPVTPNDDEDLPEGITRALLIGTDGDLKVQTRAGNTRIFYSPIALLPLQVTRVYATGTTATDISAVY
jgi:hypothetical protein